MSMNAEAIRVRSDFDQLTNQFFDIDPAICFTRRVAVRCPCAHQNFRPLRAKSVARGFWTVCSAARECLEQDENSQCLAHLNSYAHDSVDDWNMRSVSVERKKGCEAFKKSFPMLCRRARSAKPPEVFKSNTTESSSSPKIAQAF